MGNLRFFGALAAAWLMAAPAAAADAGMGLGASAAVTNEAGTVQLLSATTAAGETASLRLGLSFTLNPGWKIYWRSPGDAGYPPKIDWSGSDNLGEPVLSWPAPTRFVLAGLQNHGYGGQVVLPVSAPVASPGKPLSVRASLDYLACAQICVPMQAALALDLPAGPAAPSAHAHLIDRFAALVPGEGARHGLAIEKAEALGEGDGSLLRVTLRAAEPLDKPDLFVEAPGLANFDQPRVSLSEGGRRAVLEAPVVPGTVEGTLQGREVTVTVVDGLRSMEARVTPTAGLGAGPGGTGDGGSLAVMLGIALLGGLILNLMPCVLPVLSIKLLGVLAHGGGERGHVRLSFLASAAGILASFLALAGAAVALKAAGAAVGWGIQFQQPLFLGAMVAVLLLFAANLWGLFEIPLPSWLMSAGAGSGRPHHTPAGHFLSGAFATLLATPCSAPFLGTAVGFALARGPLEISAIFAALGLGMSLPFLAVAAWPEVARRLPRPGPWMLTLRKAMGVALAGTALWLGTVLASTLESPLESPADAAPSSSSTVWRPFQRDAIPALVAEGKVVFVDVTADWCITCKVNKAAVLDRGEVARRLATPAVVALRADWTRPDPAIAAYLAEHGRYGIPFNAVYGPGAPSGIALPELLTEAEVAAALDRAAGKGAAAPAAR